MLSHRGLEKDYSIIIPTLNEQILLPRLLQQLKNQTYRNFEVIVVDGQSTDKTVELAKSFVGLMDVKIFESSRRGVSFQKNLGALESKGKYLIFFDADIEVLPTFLVDLDRELMKGNFESVAPNWWRYPHIPFWERVMMFFAWETSFFTQYIGKPIGGAGAMIVSRSAFLRVGKFDEKVKLAEDCLLLQNLKKNGIKTKYLRKPSVHISQRRIKKDGLGHVLWLYLKSTIYQFRGGDHAKYEADYQMGGEYHGDRS